MTFVQDNGKVEMETGIIGMWGGVSFIVHSKPTPHPDE